MTAAAPKRDVVSQRGRSARASIPESSSADGALVVLGLFCHNVQTLPNRLPRPVCFEPGLPGHHRAVEQADDARRLLTALEHSKAHQPAYKTCQVVVAELANAETGFLQQVAHTGPGVAAEMAQASIDFAHDRGEGRNIEDQSSTGLEGRVRLRQSLSVMFDVLQ